jgi:hypothetical protein
VYNVFTELSDFVQQERKRCKSGARLKLSAHIIKIIHGDYQFETMSSCSEDIVGIMTDIMTPGYRDIALWSTSESL